MFIATSTLPQHNGAASQPEPVKLALMIAI